MRGIIMPYVNETFRKELDHHIQQMIIGLKSTVSDNAKPFEIESLTNEELLTISGNINYAISRICGSIMGKISYPKIVVITGVLENVKQEFYRRAASKYEDAKIISNGDIPEYKKV